MLKSISIYVMYIFSTRNNNYIFFRLQGCDLTTKKYFLTFQRHIISIFQTNTKTRKDRIYIYICAFERIVFEIISESTITMTKTYS